MFKPGDTAVWTRQERGGKRRFVEIPVTVQSVTAAWNVTVSYTRNSKTVTVIVKPTSLKEG